MNAIAGMIEVAVTNAMREATINPEAKVMLSEVLPEYFEHKNKELKGNKHFDEIRSKIWIFLSVVGDKPIHTFAQKDMQDYRDLLDEMPAKAMQHFKTDDPRLAIPLNKKRKVPVPAISPTTVNAKYLSAVRGLFQYLADRKIISGSPMDGVHSEQKEEDLLPVEKRLPFTKDHIATLRRNADTKPKWSADRWWIRFMHKAGLRDEEFAELSAADFREFNGRLCIDFLHLEDGDPINRARRKQLRIKSPAGRRVLPIHRSLLDDDVMELVEKRRRESGPLAMLFPQLEPDKYGAFSSALSKRLNRQVDEVVIDPRYVAYSARHTFAAACDAAGVPAKIRDRLMGHEPDKDEEGKPQNRRGPHVRTRYGSPIMSAEEMAWIDKVEF
jgi:site-specific recombinase XerD